MYLPKRSKDLDRSGCIALLRSYIARGGIDEVWRYNVLGLGLCLDRYLDIRCGT